MLDLLENNGENQVMLLQVDSPAVQIHLYRSLLNILF
jgi:hypothetical protein